MNPDHQTSKFFKLNLAGLLSFAFTLISSAAFANPHNWLHSLDSKTSLIARIPTVMPLGDSNTFGWNVNQGYREPLSNLMTQNFLPIEMVGSQIDLRSPWFTNNHHEGHSGWTAEELQNGRDGLLPMESVTRYQPDVILLMAGTNDFLQKGATVEVAERNFRNLLAEIQKRSPNSLIVIATLFPVVDTVASPRKGSQPDNDQVNLFNLWLLASYPPAVVGDGKVMAFDMNSHMDYVWFDDGVHPNWSGYQVVGQTWYSALAPIVSRLTGLSPIP